MVNFKKAETEAKRIYSKYAFKKPPDSIDLALDMAGCDLVHGDIITITEKGGTVLLSGKYRVETREEIVYLNPLRREVKLTLWRIRR